MASPSDTRPPLDVRMKRTSAGDMFRLAAAYLRETAPTNGARGASAPFAVLPQFMACVRLDPESIRLYFAHLHPRANWRTRAARVLLTAATKAPPARSAVFEGPVARALGGAFVYDPAADYPDVDWAGVDVLLAEWQFVGVFSGRAGTVSHVLIDDKYERCLQNEVEARESLAAWVSAPPVLRARQVGPVKGWTEPFLLNEATLDERRDPFDELQAMLCVAYAATAEETDLGDYVGRLEQQAGRVYPAGAGAAEAVGEPLRRVLADVRAQAEREGAGTVPIARCHGDLNLGQVMVTGDDKALIDWSESEPAVAFHDYVYNALWRHGWDDLSAYPDVPWLRVLRSGLRDALGRVSPRLAAGLVLAEVALKQHVDYNEQRGTIKIWTRLADHYLASSPPNSPTPAPARSSFPAPAGPPA